MLGAGPSGAAASFYLSHLSKGKLSVLSLEKLDKNYDLYHRMCGEAISAKAFQELSPLEPQAVTFDIERAVEHWPGEITIDTEARGYILDRPAFLRKVLELASKEGGHVEKGTAVSISKENQGYVVRTRDGREYRSKWLVGADGWNSLVRRSFFLGGPRLLWAEQHVLPTPTEPNVMHFHYDQRYQGGYRWVFPHPLGSRVGFTKGSEPRPNALEHHVRPIPYGYGECVKGNACLVGDAGGQANPITFGGIRIGMAAAKMMASSLVKGDLRSYARDWPASKHVSPRYVQAFELLQGMDNDALHRSVRPFRKGYGAKAGLMAMLSGKRNRSLYRAYYLAAEWGW